MLEWGLRILPPGVSQFVLVADAQDMSMRQLMQFSFMRVLMKVFLELYPDRIALILVGPTSMILRNLYSMVKPLLPRNVQNKIKLLSEDPKQALLVFLFLILTMLVKYIC